MTDEILPDPDDKPSKSQRKREAHAQQALGVELGTLPAHKLDKLPLPAVLRQALDEFQRLPNSHGARKRQRQYIGKLMRDCDYEAISAALAELQQDHPQAPVVTANQADTLQAHTLTILSGGDSGIETLLASFPQLERQRLRQFQLNYARKSGPGRAAVERKLRAYLAELLP